MNWNVAAPLIGAGANLIGGLWQGSQNRKATEEANRENRWWSEKMYYQQQRDQERFWNMQNAYNDPSAQMQRLQGAGLNPHLVYGNGATATAGPMSINSAPSYHAQPAHISGIPESLSGLMTGTLSAIYDIQQKKANIAQTEAQTRAITATTSNQEFLNQLNDPSYLEALRTYSKESKYNELSLQRGNMDAQSLGNIQREMDIELSRVLNPIKIDTYRQQLKNAVLTNDIQQLDKTMKSLENDLAKRGIYRNDPMWMRAIGRFLSDVVGIDYNVFDR